MRIETYPDNSKSKDEDASIYDLCCFGEGAPLPYEDADPVFF